MKTTWQMNVMGDPVEEFPVLHSHSCAPCAPAFLAGATGRRRRVPKKEGHQPLYSPPLGHPRDPPLRHPPRPCPPSGTHRALCRATPGLRRAHVHPPLGTHPGVRLPCSPIGYRGLLCRATPSGLSVKPLRPASPSGHPVWPTVP
jgi:hypothetical protein